MLTYIAKSQILWVGVAETRILYVRFIDQSYEYDFCMQIAPSYEISVDIDSGSLSCATNTMYSDFLTFGNTSPKVMQLHTTPSELLTEWSHCSFLLIVLAGIMSNGFLGVWLLKAA